jgi:hypothetical protein
MIKRELTSQIPIIILALIEMAGSARAQNELVKGFCQDPIRLNNGLSGGGSID